MHRYTRAAGALLIALPLLAGADNRSCGPRKITEANSASRTVGPALEIGSRLPSTSRVSRFGEEIDSWVVPRSNRIERETDTRLDES